MEVVMRSLLKALLPLLVMMISACSEPSTNMLVEPEDCFPSSDCYDAPAVVVLGFEEGTSDEAILAFLAALGLNAQSDIYGAEEKWVTVTVAEGTEDEWIDTLLAYEMVAVAERDKICPVHGE